MCCRAVLQKLPQIQIRELGLQFPENESKQRLQPITRDTAATPPQTEKQAEQTTKAKREEMRKWLNVPLRTLED